MILKRCAVFLIEPVYHLFSPCLFPSYLPKEWHNHYITPIPKSKYRRGSILRFRIDCPISLHCCRSKVLKRLAFDMVSDFMFQNCISHCQFGFVSNRSSLEQLLQYQNLLYTLHPLTTANKLTLCTLTYERPSILSLTVKFLPNCGPPKSQVACGISSTALVLAGNNVLW